MVQVKSLLISFALAGALLCPCCNVQTALAAEPEAAEATVALHVEGMHCPSCTVTVKAALKKLDGVHDAQVSSKEKRARVTYDAARVTPERMVQAVKDAGYDATIEG